ncbi:LOW QUALITY PROTEIN: hypothetical protein U9M48_023468 [Paspalum notatum var. saurae]|uniref:Reverse transcriptase Ty1/copia-type domain-containing protein n=1 Tax=Paspalum notatum var. saurae TaxID=547442 RepID=A0AAQ3WVT7_PASNO
MKDLGAAKKILCMEVSRDRKSGLLFLNQHNYIQKVLRHFNMHNSKPVNTSIAPHFKLSSSHHRTDLDFEYMSKVSFQCCWFFDLCHGLFTSRFIFCYELVDTWLLLVRTLKCCEVDFPFGRTREGLVGYINSDYAADLDKRRSLTGYWEDVMSVVELVYSLQLFYRPLRLSLLQFVMLAKKLSS